MRETKPSSKPTLTSCAITPSTEMKSTLSNGYAGKIGASSSAMTAPVATRIVTGKFAIVKNGNMSKNALTRKNTSIQLEKSTSIFSSLDHLRHFLDNGGGEFNERTHYPRHQQQQD